MRLVLAVSCFALVCCQVACATTIVVDVNGGPGSDYVTIGEGLLAAGNHDTLFVRPGTYAGPQNKNLDPLGREVVIITSGWDTLDVDGTIIDCEGAGRAFDIHSGEGRSLFIAGFTIENGFTIGPGGGISVSGASPTIEHCLFRDCESTDFGGAVWLDSSSAWIREAIFNGNSATYGGALTTESSSATVADCEFWGNAAGPGSGGAVYCTDGDDSAFDELAFLANEAYGGGGALCADWGSTPDIRNSLFFDNGATGPGGGAIACLDDGTDALISGNTIVQNGGVLAEGALLFGPETQGTLYQNIIAFSLPAALADEDLSFVTAYNNCVFANAGGDSLSSNSYENMFGQDPLLCDRANLDFSLAQGSPCLAVNNSWGLLLGTYEQGCVESPAEPVSWGAIKAMYR